MHVFELPSGTEVELREMTGAEEELLTNQRLIRTGEAVNQVFRNGIVRLGENEGTVHPGRARSLVPGTGSSSWSSSVRSHSATRSSWN